MRATLKMLTLVGAVGLLVAGCGGGSGPKPLTKAEYIKEMKAIGTSLSTSINALSSVSTAKDAATALAKVQTDLRDAIKELDKITPPTNVQKPHQQLTKAVGEFADELGPLITKLKAGNLTALSSLSSLKGLADIQTAAAAITKAGYNISG